MRAEAHASVQELVLLLDDTMTAARLVDAHEGLPDQPARVALGRIVVAVAPGTEVRLAGVIAMSDGTTAVTTGPGDDSGSRYHRVSARVLLVPDRSAAARGWLERRADDLVREAAPTPSSDRHHDLLPGAGPN